MLILNQIPFENKLFDDWNWNVRPGHAFVRIFDSERRMVELCPPFPGMYVGIQGTKALNGRRVYWETKIQLLKDDHSFISGIASKDPLTGATGTFTRCLGRDNFSWGLSRYGLTFHKNAAFSYSDYIESKTMGVFFDGIAGTLSYFVDGKCLGVAFNGLHKIKQPLFPTVSCNLKPMRITLKQTYCELLNLRELCILKVSSMLTNKEEAHELELPKTIADDIARRLW